MVIVQYSSGKLLVRGLLFFVGGLALMGTLIGAPLGLYLIAYGLRALIKAMTPNKAAITQHARGLEIRTLWTRRFVSFDHYTHVSAETIFFNAAGLPIPGPVMLVIHSERRGLGGGIAGKRKIRLPLGYLRLVERAVPLVGEAIEIFAMPHREAGATWHKVLDERRAAEGGPPPPRQLATAEERAAARRDPLEGGARDRLDRAPTGFGRKVA
ncbi:MAG: hypothetical protein JNL35_02135 [Sphingopyxis sp.]|nr:hypothetical protein [Sphingopyxis sp.]